MTHCSHMINISIYIKVTFYILTREQYSTTTALTLIFCSFETKFDKKYWIPPMLDFLVCAHPLSISPLSPTPTLSGFILQSCSIA